MKEILSLFDRRAVPFVVSLLAGIILVLLGMVDELTLKDTKIVLIQDAGARWALMAAGALTIGAGMLFWFRDRRAPTSEAEARLRAYYDALNETSAAGYERAWGMLSPAKKDRFGREFGWTNSSGFQRGFASVITHDPVMFSRESASEQSETFLVAFIVHEEYPSSPARETVLGTTAQPMKAQSVLDAAVMARIVDQCAGSVQKHFNVEGVTDQALKVRVGSMVREMDLLSITSPDLIETLGLKLRLTAKEHSSIKNRSGNGDGFWRVKMINVQRRTLVRESKEWRIGDVELLAEYPLRQ